MASAETVIQVCIGAVPCSFSRNYQLNPQSGSLSRPFLAYKGRTSTYFNVNCSSRSHHECNIYFFPQVSGINGSSYYSRLFKCSCKRVENVNGLTSEDGNDSLCINGNIPGSLEFETSSRGDAFSSNGNVIKKETKRDTKRNNVTKSLEDEAWELLKESIVYYCGSPVGTIAAQDPTTSNVLNYDQVFIRDIIPSGIAFLLKGEYEIARNFILHTLQLQSWEKTMDCHSPGQGLMPASFKVHTVLMDGDDSTTEEILDPDFAEAAIGRVAPVDSGLWWIILLRAYGKYTRDLSVQERVNVQTGIKMILKLCLADGFDMFPTLLVTDGSCMIDHRMGIHGHPLEIQRNACVGGWIG